MRLFSGFVVGLLAGIALWAFCPRAQPPCRVCENEKKVQKKADEIERKLGRTSCAKCQKKYVEYHPERCRAFHSFRSGSAYGFTSLPTCWKCWEEMEPKNRLVFLQTMWDTEQKVYKQKPFFDDKTREIIEKEILSGKVKKEILSD